MNRYNIHNTYQDSNRKDGTYMDKQYALKVLSIDMDFFQKVDYGTLLECYPDGHDYSSYLSTLVWSSHYSNPHECDRINNVTCPLEWLDTLVSILHNQSKGTPVLISQSHLHIYEFIHDKLAERELDFLEIVNVDMHHDMFYDYDDNSYDNCKVHCGNWAHHIREEVPTRFTWISNPVSKEAMNYEEVADLDDEVKIIEGDLSQIKEDKFDAIFLCRSDAWYPPHLDCNFTRLVDLMSSHFRDTVVQEGLGDRSNYMREMVDFDKLVRGEETL